MGFSEIYWPVFSALISALVVSELFQMGLSYWIHRKQEKLREEFEAKVASGEIDPMQVMFGGSPMPGGPGGPPMNFPNLPTSSGNGANGADIRHGQYL